MTKSNCEPVVTLLVDNHAWGDLATEHGFSAWVEVAGMRLLFDTGQGTALRANAKALGVDLRTTDVLVLSHGHYDHTGGLPWVLEQAPKVVAYAHPGLRVSRYSIREGKARSIGMPDESRDALGRIRTWRTITGPTELAPGLGLTGPIPRRTTYEDTGGPFFLDPEGDCPDPIVDDLGLWMRTPRGLLVVTGCGHAGVINTVRHAVEVSGESRVHAVIGGFHLGAASEERLDRTAEAFRKLGIDLIVPCHCTGDRAVARLKEALGEQVVAGRAGQKYATGHVVEPMS
jgi:7,8-dihydropterin-6-yl-methyl-4-(beta-D-ribofuranosyl)aminobenzene 5'-phosphate synthase